MFGTKVFYDDYKGKPVLAIKKVDADGDSLEDRYPVVSFGLVKAKAILEHIEEIRGFVEDNE